MKVLILSLLLLLLCSTQVFTLTCYTCETSDCKEETVCPESATFCKTVLTNEGDIDDRTCEETCSEDYVTRCCMTDLCSS
ncbi:lymphocyte antigen 6D [Pholidichthys leucotaenia]